MFHRIGTTGRVTRLFRYFTVIVNASPSGRERANMPNTKLPIVYLEWIDAYGNSDWFTKSEAESFIKNDCWMKEAGFLIRETKKYLIFAQRLSGYNKGYKFQYGALHKIPKTWIRKRKILGRVDVVRRER